MITKRIIPCLDVKNGRVVKGVNFAGLQDMADPVEMARYYNAAGADELVFYDITASVEGRTIFTDILRRGPASALRCCRHPLRRRFYRRPQWCAAHQ